MATTRNSLSGKTLRTERRSVPSLWLGVERLEDRLLLSRDVPDVLSVGRTLSAWSVADLTNREVTITYTVFNQQSEPIQDVLLTDTLQPGVTFKNASGGLHRNGQELAWNLGRLEPFGRTSVELTVILATPELTQLDAGAQAFGTLQARTVQDTVPPATLRTTAIPASLLASTPEANTADPFIQAKAAELDYDPQRIVEFLTKDIGYNSYKGSLRGARGALWSQAANSLDEASLGVALMRVSGIPARYGQGILADAQAKSLILSMFPSPFQTVGYIPNGSTVADPANDPILLAETREHFWFQFDPGTGFLNADTSFANAQIGESFSPLRGTFVEIPDALRHKIRVSLNVEQFHQASALLAFGDGISTTTVLDYTFNTAELVGRPLTLGHFVSTSSLSALLFTTTTNVYSPFLARGDDAFDPSQDVLFAGQNYQEFLTNFPLGNQIVTGVFLQFAVSGPGVPVETFERALVDRIGFAARQGGTGTSTRFDPNGPPAFSAFDAFTVYVQPGLQDPRTALLHQQKVAALAAKGEAAQGQTLSVLSQGGGFRDLLVAQTRAIGASFLTTSDSMTEYFEDASQVKAYHDRPRIILVFNRLEAPDAQGNTDLTFGIDLRSNGIRSLAYPGQEVSAVIPFRALRGQMDSVLESDLLPLQAPGQASPTVRYSLSAVRIFDAAIEQGIDFVTLTSENLNVLDALTFSPEAKARITAAVRGGREVVVPRREVNVQGTSAIAWYEFRRDTGDLVGVTESGDHGWLAGLASYLITWSVKATVLFFIYGALVGISARVVQKICLQFDPAQTATCLMMATDIVKTAKNNMIKVPVLYDAFKLGVTLLGFTDPPVVPFHVGLDRPTLEPGDLFNAVTPVTATRTPGSVAAQLDSGSLTVKGDISASWSAPSESLWNSQSLVAENATLRDANGTVIGTGTVRLTNPNRQTVTVAGPGTVTVSGVGSLSLYPPGGNLGASATWDQYSATIAGFSELRFSGDSITLNGIAVPSGSFSLLGSTASLSGSGPTPAPQFVAGISLDASQAVLSVGPSQGNLTLDGTAVDVAQGVTLSEFHGRIEVSAGDNIDRVTLNGTAGHVVHLSTPATLTTDQNTPLTLRPQINTTLSGDYNLIAQAPLGWVVTITPDGQVSVTPAPGLQGGTYPIRILARSVTRPELVTQADVLVTITPTQPEIRLILDPDVIYTVPVGDAQLPSVFRARIQNLGPEAQTVDLTFPTVPGGFTIVPSVPRLTIPAGETGIVGISLFPSTNLPVAGTQAPFTVTATSASNPNLSASQTEAFVVPEVRAVTLTADSTAVNSTPGTPVSTNILVTNVGNVAVDDPGLVASLPPGLTLTGLGAVALAPGQSAMVTVTLTPGSEVPLNSILRTRITATFGVPQLPFPTTLDLAVHVVVPGAQALGKAAAAVRQMGQESLAQRFDDLSMALTNLVQNPTNASYKGQVVSALDAIVRGVVADPIMATFRDRLIQDQERLSTASGASAIQAAIMELGSTLETLGTTSSALSQGNFEVFLPNNSQTAQPQAPITFEVRLHNLGTQRTTYNVRLDGLPQGVTGQLSASQITLDRDGIASGLFVTLVQPAATELLAFPFTVTVSVDGAPAVARTASGALTVRRETVSVVDVASNPAFTEPGGAVQVTARVLNAVNREQEALVRYVLKDAQGQTVRSTPPVPVTLTVQASLKTVDLGILDTSGLARGPYTLEVDVTDPTGRPIPGATGTGSLLVGSPVTGALTVSSTIVPPGTSRVPTQLTVDARAALPPEFQLVGVGAAPGGGDLVRHGNLVYVAQTTGIQIFDVTDKSNPISLRTFGTPTSNVEIQGDKLIALRGGTITGASAKLSIYSLSTDPTNPTLLGSTPEIPHTGLFDMLLTETHAYITSLQYLYFPGNIIAQSGDLFSIDISNPAAPFLADVLVNTFGTTQDGRGVAGGVDQSGGPFNVFNVEQVDATTLYITTTTSTGGDPHIGIGRLRVVDISNPADMKIVEEGELQIPGTIHLTGLRVEGDRALVTGSSGGWNEQDPTYGLTGFTVLATVDVSNARRPRLLTSQTLLLASRGIGATFEPVGPDLYAFAGLGEPLNPHVTLVNTKDPNHFLTREVPVPELAPGLFSGDGFLYTADVAGLKIYAFGNSNPIPVTAQVQIPKGTGVQVDPNSFSLPPTRILSGENFDTLVWELTLSDRQSTSTLTWDTLVSALQPGETRAVTGTTTLDFTRQGTSGQVLLGSRRVAAEQILSLTPSVQTVRPGGSASYTVKVANPGIASATYTLSLAGIPQSWATLAETVVVPPGGTVEVPLTITTDPTTSRGENGFVVTARTDTTSSSVEGHLILGGDSVFPDTESRGVIVSLLPVETKAGQGTPASYVVRVTNTGNTSATWVLSTNLPSEFLATLDQSTIEVAPGESNSRDVGLRITPRLGTAPGVTSFEVRTESTSSPRIQGMDQGQVTVVTAGVALQLTPDTGNLNSIFQAVVTNTGQDIDTFDVTLAGPGALVASLEMPSVTLAPNETRTLDISIGSMTFAFPGMVSLMAVATSRSQPTVKTLAHAEVRMPVIEGLRAAFEQNTVRLPQPGSTPFLMVLENTGNRDEEYTATITGIEGPMTAFLIGPDGPTQTLTGLRVSGLSRGALLLQATQTAAGRGTATVEIRSRRNPALVATDTVVVTSTMGRVSGTLFLDYNADGVQNSGEPSLPGRSVYLDINGDGQRNSGDPATTTDASGNYQFTNLADGTYLLRQDYRPYHGTVLSGPSEGQYALNLTGGGEKTNQGFGNVFISQVSPVDVAPVPLSNGDSEESLLVRRLYRSVLGREPDASGLAYWGDRVRQAGENQQRREEVTQWFWRSREHRGLQVDQYYATYLERTADDTGRTYWVDRFLNGSDEYEIVAGFLSSSEYRMAYGAPEAFVQQLYDDVLSRTADDAGLPYWRERLSTSGLESVVHDFLRSEESSLRIVDGYYAALLHRPGEASGRQFWLEQIQSGFRTPGTAAEYYLSVDEFRRPSGG